VPLSFGVHINTPQKAVFDFQVISDMVKFWLLPFDLCLTFTLDTDTFNTDTLHMDAPTDNPAFNLPPKMIVGLLWALNNSSDPVVREFHLGE